MCNRHIHEHKFPTRDSASGLDTPLVAIQLGRLRLIAAVRVYRMTIRWGVALCVTLQLGGCFLLNDNEDPPPFEVFVDGGSNTDATVPPDGAPGPEYAQEVYLKAANPGKDDAFGAAVAIDGDTIIVSATGEDSAAIGINGDDISNSRSNSGAVYVFVKQDGDWGQQAYLKASNPSVNDSFGEQVAIDGDTLVVSASHEDSVAKGVNGEQDNDDNFDSGAVYVFVRQDGVWSQEAYLKASNSGWNDEFGSSICLDNDTLIVGAAREKGNGNSEDDNSTDGSGAVYVFQRSGSTWSQQAYLKASNPYPYTKFGASCALSGDRLAIGSPAENSSSAGIDGDQYDVESDRSGAVYFFARQGTTWTQETYIKSVEPRQYAEFGSSLALIGDSLVVGAPGKDDYLGGIELFTRSQGSWTYQNDLNPAGIPVSNRGLGTKLANNATHLMVGKRYPFFNSSSKGRTPEIFTIELSFWTSSTILESESDDNTDRFGGAFAISSDNVIVVGAKGEDSRAQGVNGNELDNSTGESGAAYVLMPVSP